MEDSGRELGSGGMKSVTRKGLGETVSKLVSRRELFKCDEVVGDGLDDEAESNTDMTGATVNETAATSGHKGAVVFVDNNRWHRIGEVVEEIDGELVWDKLASTEAKSCSSPSEVDMAVAV